MSEGAKGVESFHTLASKKHATWPSARVVATDNFRRVSGVLLRHSLRSIASRQEPIWEESHLRAIQAVIARQFRSLNWTPQTSGDWKTFAADFFPSAVQAVGQTFAVPILGGLHHQYIRA